MRSRTRKCCDPRQSVTLSALPTARARSAPRRLVRPSEGAARRLRGTGCGDASMRSRYSLRTFLPTGRRPVSASPYSLIRACSVALDRHPARQDGAVPDDSDSPRGRIASAAVLRTGTGRAHRPGITLGTSIVGNWKIAIARDWRQLSPRSADVRNAQGAIRSCRPSRTTLAHRGMCQFPTVVPGGLAGGEDQAARPAAAPAHSGCGAGLALTTHLRRGVARAQPLAPFRA